MAAFIPMKAAYLQRNIIRKLMMEYIIGRKEDIKGMDERQRPKSWAEAFFMLETFLEQ